MSDFTTRVHTDDNYLKIQLPQNLGPGDYVVTIKPIVVERLPTFSDEEKAQAAETARFFHELVEKHQLKAPAGWKFNRDELYDR